MLCTRCSITTLRLIVERLAVRAPLRLQLSQPPSSQPFSTQTPRCQEYISYEGRKIHGPRTPRKLGWREIVDAKRKSNQTTASSEKGHTSSAPSLDSITEKSSAQREDASAAKHGDSDLVEMEKMRGSEPKSRPRPEGYVRSQKKNPFTEARDEARERKSKPETWQVQKKALDEKFGEERWTPRKRLSPDTLEGIRTMHASDPEQFTTPVLAEHFKVSPEAIRRILKSKWQPQPDEMEDRRRRWENRGERIWSTLAEIGTRPPKKWREMGIGKAEAGDVPKWKKSPVRRERPLGKPVDIAVRPSVATRGRIGPAGPKTFADRIL